MTDVMHRTLGPGDRAPDFELPAADAEGTVTLAAHLRRGPVLLTMLRGLYCPFCRRHISQLRPACEALRAAGIALLGVVVASPERARQYFRHFPACFPMAAAPDHTIHHAYGLPEVARTPEFVQETERRASDILREQGLEVPPGQARSILMASDGFVMTPEDQAAWQRPHQTVGQFLIGRDGVIRWVCIDSCIVPLPEVEELAAAASTLPVRPHPDVWPGGRQWTSP
jgi:peroxiredoxin